MKKLSISLMTVGLVIGAMTLSWVSHVPAVMI